MKRQYVALLLALSVVGVSAGAQIYVDDDAPNDPSSHTSKTSDPNEDGSEEHPFDDIQEAIDAAVDGDTIVVAPGRYLSPDKWEYDEITFNGKNIRLVSSAPTDFTVIDQTVLCGVVIFDGTESSDCLLQGFKIQNYAHGGILGNGTQARISHCIISGNGPCGATVVMNVQGCISNCLIVDNTTFHDCGLLPVVSGCAEFVNCTIANNLTGIDMVEDNPIVRNCIIYANQSLQRVPSSISRGGQYQISTVQYNLIEDMNAGFRGVIDADPCFARPGSWIERSVSTRTGTGTDDPTKRMALVEGDYHLKSEGWRWNPQPIHGSHWYFDAVTSPAIDAGDPMDSLGEEFERAPDDAEGIWGVNHAINLGAYGGTAQASLAPTDGEAPGVAAVDLRDYWPFGQVARGGGGTYHWYVHTPQGTTREFYMSGGMRVGNNDVHNVAYHLSIANATDWLRTVDCYYADRTLYMTQDKPLLNPPQAPQHVQAQYPQYLVAGSTIQAPYDPFTIAPVEYRSVLVTRGTLSEVLTGTSVDPSLILEGSWPDVIAFRELGEDGTAGDPIAIFARGFGPLMIAGCVTKGAVVNNEEFGTATLSRGG